MNFNSYIAHIIFKFFSLFLLLFYFFCSIFKHLFKLINNYNFLKIYKKKKIPPFVNPFKWWIIGILISKSRQY